MVINVLLLSGGRSERMGCDKSVLEINRMPLLQWQESRLIEAGFNVISGLKDRFTGAKGPLAGIEAACHVHSEIDDWVVIPVDMPLLSAATLVHIAEQGRAYRGLTCFEHCPLPLYLPRSSEICEQLNLWLKDEHGRRSVYAFIEHFGGQWLSAGGFQTELVNINTPLQWNNFLTGGRAK